MTRTKSRASHRTAADRRSIESPARRDATVERTVELNGPNRSRDATIVMAIALAVLIIIAALVSNAGANRATVPPRPGLMPLAVAAKYARYCKGHGTLISLQIGHIRMRPHARGSVPVADALELPVGRTVEVASIRCVAHADIDTLNESRPKAYWTGYARELPGGGLLTYQVTTP